MRPVSVRRFTEAPRHALAVGAGGVRDLWVGTDDASGSPWQLQLVELRGPHGRIQLPEGMNQLVVGVSGAQVIVQADSTRPAPLRRDQALLTRASFVDFHRPGIRGIGLSRVLVLSSAASVPAATFEATAVDGPLQVASTTLALVVMRGGVKVGAVAAGRESAIIVGGDAPLNVVATSAQVLSFARPSREA